VPFFHINGAKVLQKYPNLCVAEETMCIYPVHILELFVGEEGIDDTNFLEAIQESHIEVVSMQDSSRSCMYGLGMMVSLLTRVHTNIPTCREYGRAKKRSLWNVC